MDDHDSIFHDMLLSLGRLEAQQIEARDNTIYLRGKVDEVCRRLRAVETKTAIIGFAAGALSSAAPTIIGFFLHGT